MAAFPKINLASSADFETAKKQGGAGGNQPDPQDKDVYRKSKMSSDIEFEEKSQKVVTARKIQKSKT